MMNLEQTKRMNFMIKELTKSGMVSSFDDAINQASGLYLNAMPEEETIVTTSGQQLESQSECEVQGQTQTPKTVSHDPPSELPHLVERKIHYSIQHNNEQIGSEFEKLREEMKSMRAHYQKELDMLKNFINTLNVSKSNEEVKTNAPQPQQTRLRSEPPTDPNKSDLNPGDVILENYFYFGDK